MPTPATRTPCAAPARSTSICRWPSRFLVQVNERAVSRKTNRREGEKGRPDGGPRGAAGRKRGPQRAAEEDKPREARSCAPLLRMRGSVCALARMARNLFTSRLRTLLPRLLAALLGPPSGLPFSPSLWFVFFWAPGAWSRLGRWGDAVPQAAEQLVRGPGEFAQGARARPERAELETRADAERGGGRDHAEAAGLERAAR